MRLEMTNSFPNCNKSVRSGTCKLVCVRQHHDKHALCAAVHRNTLVLVLALSAPAAVVRRREPLPSRPLLFGETERGGFCPPRRLDEDTTTRRRRGQKFRWIETRKRVSCRCPRIIHPWESESIPMGPCQQALLELFLGRREDGDIDEETAPGPPKHGARVTPASTQVDRISRPTLPPLGNVGRG